MNEERKNTIWDEREKLAEFDMEGNGADQNKHIIRTLENPALQTFEYYLGSDTDEDDEDYNYYDGLNNILDISFIINAERKYKHCILVMSTGGPHCELNTQDGKYSLYWWGLKYSVEINRDTCNKIDEFMEQYYDEVM